MTHDAVQKALLKLGGERCTVHCSMHRLAGQDDDHRFTSESWSGTVVVEIEGEDNLRATVPSAPSGEALIRLMKTELRNVLHARTFARKQQALNAPQQAIGATYRLEHHV